MDCKKWFCYRNRSNRLKYLVGSLFCCREWSVVSTPVVECTSGDDMLNVPSAAGLTAKPAIGRSEYGRVKVALPRGKGIMDWVSLTTGRQLASKRMAQVDHVELAKHDKEDDCWICIFGQVYDVTQYLEFHPGGIPELMRAAGRDGTDLFNQYHAWVNYETMLKSCRVGQFRGDSSKLKPCDPPTKDNSESQGDSSGIRDKITVLTTADRLFVMNDDWKGISSKNVTVYVEKGKLRLLVRPFGMSPVQIEWKGVPTPISTAPFTVSTEANRVVVKFGTDISLKILESPGLYKVTEKPPLQYHPCTVHSVKSLSKDTRLYELRLPEGLYMPFPLGHHMSVMIKKGAATLYREYTPVGGDEERILLMVKIYSDGICTPTVEQWKKGDTVSISDPIGDWDLSDWVAASANLVVIAAGSGWTPMVEIIRERIDNGVPSPLHVYYFNKSEDDVIVDEWMPFRWEHPHLKVTHVLSRPSVSWTGPKGRITRELLEHLAKEEEREKQRIVVCGPDGFIQSAVGILTELGYGTDQVHVFQG